MRKTTLHSLFTLVAAFAMTVASAQQDINFDDLKRQGRPLTKTLVVEGAGRDGQGLLQQFSEVDDARVETRRQLFSSTNSSSSAASSGSPASSGTSRNNPQAGKGSGGSGKVEYIKDFWLLKGEQKQIVIRCPNGVERGYSYFPKTGNYCTPSMTCNSSEAWIHRAIC